MPRKHLDLTRRTALYRLRHADGELLYVGVAFDPERRFRQHAADKPWWHLVAEKAVEWFPDRVKALEAEIAAIRSESPRYNQDEYDVPDSYYKPSTWASVEPAEADDPYVLSERRRIGARIRSLREWRNLRQDGLERLTGISWRHISRIENAAASAGIDSYIRIARALDVPLSSLFDDSSATPGGGGSEGGASPR